MTMKISRVIESKLRFLALTRAGKIRLTVFSDKVIYKALNLLQRSYSDIPDNPFNTYYALCILECQRLQLQPDWNTLDNFPNFDEDGDVTLNNEKFDMKKCNDIMRDFGKRVHNSRPVSGPYKGNKKDTVKTSHGLATFNRGIKYFKYGQWYAYPDQQFSRDSRPSMPTSVKQADWLIKQGICPKQILRDGLHNLAEEQKALFQYYTSPLMIEFLHEQRGDKPKTDTPNTGPQFRNPIPDSDDPRRLKIKPIEELEKAIRTGSVKKTGLGFLREVYKDHKPELLPIIDEYLNREDEGEPIKHNQADIFEG